MKCEWRHTKIKDILSFVVDNRGKTPPTQEFGYPLLEVNAVSATDKFPQYQVVRKYVSQETYDTKFRKGHPKVGDILVPTVGTLGAVSYVDKMNCCIAQNIVALRVNGLVCDSNFLYYILRNPTTRKRLLNLDIGGVQPSIKVPHLLELDILLPPLLEQEKIAAILSSLDDKIKLNNKINENLQQQMQAIYQEWFGDVNATQEQKTLLDICTYSKKRVPVSDLDINTYFSTENMQPEKAGAVKASSLPTAVQTTACHMGDTLISNIRPYFKKIVYCYEECGCSTDVLCFVPVHPKYSAYLYSTLYADKFFDFMVAGSKGTKMPRGDKQQIMTYPVVLPSDEQLSKFNSLAMPILEQIHSNRCENERLSKIRDALLPKLMSGEIDVSGISH